MLELMRLLLANLSTLICFISADVKPNRIASEFFRLKTLTTFFYFSVESLELMKYFPFWPTLENLFQVVSHLFNLKFVVSIICKAY